MLTSSFAWTSSPASAAITSFAFMFDEVPEPVWKTSIGNWSSSSPLATRSAGGGDPLRLVGVEQPELGVHPRRGGLDAAEPARDRRRDRLAGDGEVLDRLARLGTAPELARLGPVWSTRQRRDGPSGRRPRTVAASATAPSRGTRSVGTRRRSSRAARRRRHSPALTVRLAWRRLAPPPSLADSQSSTSAGPSRRGSRRVVGGDRGLAHADRDQRDLARVAGDVARGVDAGAVRRGSILIWRLPSSSRPQSAIAPRCEWKPSSVISASQSTCSTLAGLRVLDRDRLDRCRRRGPRAPRTAS